MSPFKERISPTENGLASRTPSSFSSLGTCPRGALLTSEEDKSPAGTTIRYGSREITDAKENYLGLGHVPCAVLVHPLVHQKERQRMGWTPEEQGKGSPATSGTNFLSSAPFVDASCAWGILVRVIHPLSATEQTRSRNQKQLAEEHKQTNKALPICSFYLC